MWDRSALESRLDEFLTTGSNDWGAIAESIRDVDKSALVHRASSMATEYAQIGEYLARRGGLGCGDHGHDKALERARRQGKRVREALSYTYPLRKEGENGNGESVRSEDQQARDGARRSTSTL